jgi:hypothetical protein
MRTAAALDQQGSKRVAVMINDAGGVVEVPQTHAKDGHSARPELMKHMSHAHAENATSPASRDWAHWAASKEGPLAEMFEDTQHGISEFGKKTRPSWASAGLVRAVAVGCIFGVVRSIAADNLGLLYENVDARDMAGSFQRAIWAGGCLGVIRLCGMAIFLGLWILLRSSISFEIDDIMVCDYAIGVALVLSSLQFALADSPVPSMSFDKAKMTSNDAFVSMTAAVPTVQLKTTNAVSAQHASKYGNTSILEMVGAACLIRLGLAWSPAFIGAFLASSAICTAVLARCLIPTCSTPIAGAEFSASTKKMYRGSINLLFVLGVGWTGAWVAVHIYGVSLTQRLSW